MELIKSCPFCGSKNLIFNLDEHEGIIICGCGARLTRQKSIERFVYIGEDIYRKIPEKSGMELVIEAWNRRAD